MENKNFKKVKFTKKSIMIEMSIDFKLNRLTGLFIGLTSLIGLLVMPKIFNFFQDWKDMSF